VDTTGLLESFGWHQRDFIAQHDFFEFCGVLRDALVRHKPPKEDHRDLESLIRVEMTRRIQCTGE
jgi:hypothetical protein